jgi:hypothetical protein
MAATPRNTKTNGTSAETGSVAEAPALRSTRDDVACRLLQYSVGSCEHSRPGEKGILPRRAKPDGRYPHPDPTYRRLMKKNSQQTANPRNS